MKTPAKTDNINKNVLQVSKFLFIDQKHDKIHMKIS